MTAAAANSPRANPQRRIAPQPGRRRRTGRRPRSDNHHVPKPEPGPTIRPAPELLRHGRHGRRAEPPGPALRDRAFGQRRRPVLPGPLPAGRGGGKLPPGPARPGPGSSRREQPLNPCRPHNPRSSNPRRPDPKQPLLPGGSPVAHQAPLEYSAETRCGKSPPEPPLLTDRSSPPPSPFDFYSLRQSAEDGRTIGQDRDNGRRNVVQLPEYRPKV